MDLERNQNSKKILPLKFYRRDTETVAKELLGKLLVHKVKGKRLSGIIVETEAYIGTEDKACHAFGGRRTKKNESLYSPGGFSYVYFIYGMYFCLNAVTQEKDCPEAVLIRALQPFEGLDRMTALRSEKTKIKKASELTSGPGKLCIALDIDRNQDGLPLSGPELFIEDLGINIPKNQIAKGPRIGVDYAGDAAHWHLRFKVKNNEFVSR